MVALDLIAPPAVALTGTPAPPRHAGECRYRRHRWQNEGKSWIPAFAGMTGWGQPFCASRQS
jgi:hypothetical protein